MTMRIALVAVALLGCKGKQEITLEDANNYSFQSTIDAENTEIKAGEDATVDWSGVTTSLLGEAVDPAAIDEVGVAKFATDMTQDDVLQGINDGTLVQSDLDSFASYTLTGDETSALLTQFDLFGYSVNPPTDIVEGPTYLVSVATVDPDTNHHTYLMFGFFTASSTSENHDIAVTDTSAVLNFEVHLDAGTPVQIDTDTGKINVDWAGLTKNGSGLDINLGDIDTMQVSHFTQAPADIEANFLEIGTMADQTFTGDVQQQGSAWFDITLEDEAGNAFTGFDPPDGTWILALECSTCINPAPPFLTVLEPPQ